MLVPIDKAPRQAPEPASRLDVAQNQEDPPLIFNQRRDHHFGVSEKDPVATRTHAQRLPGNQPGHRPGPAGGAVGDHRGRRKRQPAATANTGRPTRPSVMYSSIDAAPSRAPSRAPQRRTAKVCPVMGTGVKGNGMAMCAISPVKRLNAMTRPASLSSDRSGIQWRASVDDGAGLTQKSYRVCARGLRSGSPARAGPLSARDSARQTTSPAPRPPSGP